jgi:ABC-2 type transport system permease protein
MLKYLLEKEFKQFFRNPFLPKLVMVFPLFFIMILPLAANFEIKNIYLSIVDNNRSTFSRRLVRKILSSGYFRLAGESSGYKTALRDIELDRADIILEIPGSFEQDLIREKEARVMISANSVNGIKGGLGSAYLSGIIADFSSEIREELAPQVPGMIVPSIEVVPEYRYNPFLRYPIFMIPALMVMLLTLLCGFLPALNIVMEKESGTIEQINVTPVKKTLFILSKLIPYWIMGFIVLTICFGIARLFYGLVPAGSLLTIYIFSSVFILSISGLGLIISNYANTIQQAMFISFFFIVSMIFLSGLYTPVESMPGWAQFISNFSPLKYLIKDMRLVYLKGSGFLELSNSFIILCGFALFFNSWAIFSYRKNI